MNEKINVDPKDVPDKSQIDRQSAVPLGGVAFQRRIITACVAIEFVAILAAFAGVSPSVYWIAIQASTMGAIFAFVLAWKVFHPLAGMALAVINALTCYRLWAVPWLIADGGLSKPLLIVIVVVRVIGWVALAIINRRARSFLGTRYSGEDGGT